MEHKKVLGIVIPDGMDAYEIEYTCIHAGYNCHRIYADNKIVYIIAYIPVGDYVSKVYHTSIGAMRFICRTNRVPGDSEMWFTWGNRIIIQKKHLIKERTVIKDLYGDYKVVEVTIGHVLTRSVSTDEGSYRILESLEYYNER